MKMETYKFNDEVSRDIQIKNIRMGGYYEYIDQMKSGWLSTHPDKYGCYALFVMDFATISMMDDFPYIMREFLKNEFSNIEKYTEISYWMMPRGLVAPFYELFCQSKNIIFCAYKQGSEFAKALWINIFKEYFPQQYQVLKRLKVVKFCDLHALISNEIKNDRDYCSELAGLLTVSEIMGLEIHEDCAYAYYIINQCINMELESAKDDIGLNEIDEQIFARAKEWVFKLNDMNAIPGNWDNLRKRGYKSLRYSNEVMESVFSLNAFGQSFARVAAMEKVLSPTSALIYAKAIMEKLHPNIILSDEDIISMAAMVMITDSYAETVASSFHYLDILMGFDTIEIEGHEREYYSSSLRENIIPKENTGIVNGAKELRKVTEFETPKGNTLAYSDYCELIDEIERMRLLIHKKDMQYDYLKRLYKEKENRNKQFESLSEQYRTEHVELIEMRRHMYLLSEEDCQFPVEEQRGYIDKLKKYSVTIIGGHNNWVQKLKGLFPDWNYISPQVSDAISEKIIINADYIYFFTDFLSHSTYYRYMNVIRKNELKFGYIHSVNVDNNILQFIRDMAEV